MGRHLYRRPADNQSHSGAWLSVNIGNQRLALILSSGSIKQITAGEVGTGKKPIVLSNGALKERVTTEGSPIVLSNGELRTIAESGESILI